jgi:hypothetical protein
MKKRMIAIVKLMQLVNSIVQNAPDFRPFQRSNQPRFPQGNQQTQGFALQQVNSSNAPLGCATCRSQWTRAIAHTPQGKGK